MVDGAPKAAFILFVDGESRQGGEAMGREAGAMLEEEIPAFLVELGRTVAASGMDYAAWNRANPGAVEALALRYM